MLKIGDYVHAGFATKGGIGFCGHVFNIVEDNVNGLMIHIQSSNKGKYGHRTFVARLACVTLIDID